MKEAIKVSGDKYRGVTQGSHDNFKKQVFSTPNDTKIQLAWPLPV